MQVIYEKTLAFYGRFHEKYYGKLLASDVKNDRNHRKNNRKGSEKEAKNSTFYGFSVWFWLLKFEKNQVEKSPFSVHFQGGILRKNK